MSVAGLHWRAGEIGEDTSPSVSVQDGNSAKHMGLWSQHFGNLPTVLPALCGVHIGAAPPHCQEYHEELSVFHMEGAPPKKEMVPTVLGAVSETPLRMKICFIFRRIAGCPTIRHLEIQNLL